MPASQHLNAYEPGQRVELHPATDAWMKGDRYGHVERVGRKLIHVKMDKSERVLRVVPANIGRILHGPEAYAR